MGPQGASRGDTKSVAAMLCKHSDTIKPQKVPKVVERARAALHGCDITPSSLKDKLSNKELNNLANTFRNTMPPEVKDEYGKLRSDSDRRQWLCQFVLDPHVASTRGFNKTTAKNSVNSEGQAQWLHLSELAGPIHLNNKELAKALVESGELQERWSEYASLAALGEKQYYFSKETLKRKTGFMEEAGVEAQSDLKSEEYTEVKEHIILSMGKSAAKKRPATREPESAERKRRRELSSNKNAFARKLKILIDRATNELNGMTKDLPKLRA